jgi:hypothetical protein
MMKRAKHSNVILGPVPRICNGLILLMCLDPWDKPKDDAEKCALFAINFNAMQRVPKLSRAARGQTGR